MDIATMPEESGDRYVIILAYNQVVQCTCPCDSCDSLFLYNLFKFRKLQLKGYEVIS